MSLLQMENQTNIIREGNSHKLNRVMYITNAFKVSNYKRYLLFVTAYLTTKISKSFILMIVMGFILNACLQFNLLLLLNLKYTLENRIYFSV